MKKKNEPNIYMFILNTQKGGEGESVKNGGNEERTNEMGDK